MPELKRCPDCAELVRAEANKCRYCGYRFDVRRSAERPATFLTSLIDTFRRPHGPEAPFDLLALWGVELRSGDVVRHWVSATMTRRQGYLVVTDQRALFFELGDRRTYRLAFDHPLLEIRAVAAEAGGRRLRVTGSHSDDIIRGLRPADSRAIVAHIGAQKQGAHINADC